MITQNESPLVLVLGAARRRAGEYAEQAAAYEAKFDSKAIADETMREHYRPLKAAIDAVVEDQLTAEEMHALLWAVRALPLGVLRDGPYGPVTAGSGHGDLSTATNKVERMLGRLINPPEEMHLTGAEINEARAWLDDCADAQGDEGFDADSLTPHQVQNLIRRHFEGGLPAFVASTGQRS